MENTQPQAPQPGSGRAKFVVFGVVVAVLVFLAYALTNPAQNLPESPLINQQGKDFSLPDLTTGDIRSLADLRGQYVILNFWASWCTACKTEVPELEALHQALKSAGVTVLGIVVQDEADDARAFASKYQMSFPSLIDLSGSIAVNYGITGLPETFVFNPEGAITRKFIGGVTREMLLAALTDAGFGQQVTGETQ